MITNSISNCAIQKEIKNRNLLVNYNKQKQMGILYLWKDTG